MVKIAIIRRLSKFLVIIILFFTTGCDSKKTSLSTTLSTEEKKELEFFLQSLLFEHRGAFVLFGSKPMCLMELHDTEIDDPAFQIWLNSLTQEEKQKIEMTKNKAAPTSALEHNSYKGWLALQKTLNTLKMKNYFFRVTPLHGTGGYDLLLVNIQQTALVLAEHYTIFREAAGMDFHPLQAVFELKNPQSLFWKNVFSMPNHLAKGLLFGFGLKNSIFGHWRFSSSNDALHLPSEEYREEVIDYLKNAPFIPSTDKESSSNFTIPLYGTFPEDPSIEKYQKEKVLIEKIYHSQDIVDVTLQRLVS